MAAGEQLALFIGHRIDTTQHRLVGRKHTVGGRVVFFLTEIGDGQIWQKVDKAPFGLGDQGSPIRQKEDILHPTPLQQNFAQSHCCAGLSGAGGHNQQRLPAVFGVKGVTHGFDGPLLVITASDILVHLNVRERLAHPPQVEQLLQIPLGVEGRHLPLGILVVLEISFKAVGEKHHRPAAVLLFQQIRIELGLLPPLGRVYTGTLGLNHRQGLAVVPVKDIVRKAHLGMVGHPL